MKAVLPAMFFAAVGMPAGIISALLLAAIVFWVAKKSGQEAR